MTNCADAAARLVVRPAGPDDVEALVGLVFRYIEFYGRSWPSSGDVEDLVRMLQSAPSVGVQLVADLGGELVGFATLYFTYSTLRAARIAILNDLYVSPHRRREGVGRALFTSCHELVRAGGFAYMEWVTAPDNAPAQALYDSMGAGAEHWVTYSI